MDLFGNHNNGDFEFDESFFDNVRKDNELQYQSQMKTNLEMGDRVRVNDFSSLCHADGRELDPIDYELLDFKLTYIVIDTRQKFTYKSKHTDYPQDIIIADPETKNTYRIGSYHVTDVVVSKFVVDL